MLFIFVIAYLIMIIVKLRTNRDAYCETMKLINSTVKCPMYHDCSSWDNLTYHNEMIYCTFHLQDHIAHQRVLM
jgi:hypothetical protein